MNTFERARMYWRLFWNLCPTCNSDAPECDTCPTCKGNREYPLSPEAVGVYARRHMAGTGRGPWGMNTDPEWLMKRADLEEGCSVNAGSRFPGMTVCDECHVLMLDNLIRHDSASGINLCRDLERCKESQLVIERSRSSVQR